MKVRERSRTPRGWRQRLPGTSGSSRGTTPTTSGSLTSELTTHFLVNKLGAQDVQRLASLAQQDGASGVTQLAKVGNQGNAPKNQARDIKRLALKSCQVPKPYMVNVPVQCKMERKQVNVDHPVLLPHEVLEHLVNQGVFTVEEVADLSSREDQTLSDQKNAFCAQFDLNDKVTIPLGFHGDGVPFQKSSHKHASTEVYSWNLLCDRDGKRYLFCNINKDFLCDCGCAGRCTMDTLMEVFCWSMHVLLDGRHPHQRHDGGQLDPDRHAKQHKPLGFHGVLLQCRGDWQWYTQMFSFPNWASKQGICWRCKATQEGPCSWRKGGPRAAWRRARYNKGEFMAKLINDGKTINPLFGCPGFTLECICIGALHAMDLGVSQDILGNIFWEAILWLEDGRSHKAKCHSLWCKLKRFYQENNVKCQVQCLYLTMIKKRGETPKLKCKGAQTRHMVPFGVQIASELHDRHGTPHSARVLELAKVLKDIYTCMDTHWDSDLAGNLSMKLAKTYNTIHNDDSDLTNVWRMKPKLHMMQEMLEYQGKELGNPRGFWEYQDEDFVGMIAKIAMRKGGGNTHMACSMNTMSRYRALMALGSV